MWRGRRFYATLHSVVYRSDMDAPTMDLSCQKRKHLRHKDQERREGLRLTVKQPKRSLETILANESVEHLRHRLNDGDGDSRDFLVTEGGDPAAPSLQLALALGQRSLIQSPEDGFIADGMPLEPKMDAVFFRVVDSNPSRKHVIPVSMAAGGRLSHRALAVTVHEKSADF